MVFSSLLFMFIYLPVVLAIYYIVPRRFRNLVLFAVSLVFYGWGEPLYIVIMIFSTLVDYTCGYMIEKHRANGAVARRFVVASVVINLSLLIFFKYYDFIVTNLALIPGLGGLKPLGIALPIGISFYTFQTMSYTIDVYRNDAPMQKNIINFGAYVTLFPQLIAGPIVKYKEVAESLDHRRETIDQFTSGISIFMVGLGKKVLLANNIGMLWDVYKAAPVSELTVAGAWLGMIAYTFQIYFDFAGYSDMAIGLGRMLGFEFLRNFNYPYISQSITDFWRRWHISLSSWFREYLYIPLGGNRRGRLMTYRNLLLVWLATGIWHGASWNFVLWGLYYALILMLEKAFLLKLLDKAPRPVRHLYALVLIVFGWTLFSIENLPQMWGYFLVMIGAAGAPAIDAAALYYLKSYLPMLVILAVASTPLLKNLYEKRLRADARAWLLPALTAVLLFICTAYLVDATYNPFLYFRF